MIDVDTVFAADRAHSPLERSLPWEESRGGVSVVVEPKPHWASDLCVWKEAIRQYCYYADWIARGASARFFDHPEITGDSVMMTARAMIAREIAAGLYAS